MYPKRGDVRCELTASTSETMTMRRGSITAKSNSDMFDTLRIRGIPPRELLSRSSKEFSSRIRVECGVEGPLGQSKTASLRLRALGSNKTCGSRYNKGPKKCGDNSSAIYRVRLAATCRKVLSAEPKEKIDTNRSQCMGNGMRKRPQQRRTGRKLLPRR